MGTGVVTVVFKFLVLVTVVGFLVCAEKLSTDVIIIGAGMAGITAGKTLSDNGVKDLLILEATDRVGGRMWEQEFAGVTIERGANWVEGVNGDGAINPIWTLAQQVHLRTLYSDYDNISANIYDNSGLLPDQILASNLTYSTNDYAQSLGTTLTEEGQDDVSVLVAERLYGKLPTTPAEMVFDYFIYDGEFAEPPRVTSLKNTQPNPTFEDFGPDYQFVADQRGYAFVIDPLSNYLKKDRRGAIVDSRLKFGKVVNKLKYSKDGVEVSTEDGSTYSAKACIITVSLGVLQSDMINFVPDLPFWKLQVLFAYDMAIYTKIWFKFPKTFWPTEPATEFLLYADERRGYYPIWQHFNNEYPGSNIIYCTVTDDESRRIERQPDNDTRVEAMAVLRSMFGADIPDPEDFLVVRWSTNRFFRGSYSNWPIGVDLVQFNELQAPIGRLYFAGEHTSRSYNGYVHGAYYSGIDSANLLLKCLKENVCPSGSTKS